MKIPRDLGGQELIKTLCRDWGYIRVHQVGSHVVLETNEPGHQRVVVPAHRVLKVGTLNGILRAVADHKLITRESIIATIR